MGEIQQIHKNIIFQNQGRPQGNTQQMEKRYFSDRGCLQGKTQKMENRELSAKKKFEIRTLDK